MKIHIVEAGGTEEMGHYLGLALCGSFFFGKDEFQFFCFISGKAVFTFYGHYTAKIDGFDSNHIHMWLLGFAEVRERVSMCVFTSCITLSVLDSLNLPKHVYIFPILTISCL